MLEEDRDGECRRKIGMESASHRQDKLCREDIVHYT